MSRTRLTRAVALVAMVTAPLLVSAAPASASDASIRAAVRHAAPTLRNDEVNVAGALMGYKRSGDPTAVEAAITKLEGGFADLRATIRAQPAHAHTVRAARSKLVQGLGAAIVAYRRLGKAVDAKASNRVHAARVETSKAVRAAEQADMAIEHGMQLLGVGREMAQMEL